MKPHNATTSANTPIHNGTARTAPRMCPVYVLRAQSNSVLNLRNTMFFAPS